MSHSIPIKTEFKSISALRSAFEALGWSFLMNSKLTNTYHSDPARNKVFPMVAVSPLTNGYDVGVTVDDVGVITLECDFYSPGKIKESLGSEFSELKKKYVLKLTEEMFEEVQIEEQFEDGSFIIIADDGL